ncbi:MAG: helix-turn-helix domain-containing protein [Frankiaceae bacterium]
MQLYGAGLSAAQVGAVLGCHGSTVWRTLRRAGVELRDEQGRTRGSNSID